MLLTFSFLNSLIFIISYKLRFKYLVNDAKINFISCPQSYDVFKKRKINNLRFFFPLNRIKPKNLPKNKQLLIIGNIKSTLVRIKIINWRTRSIGLFFMFTLYAN